MMVIIIPNNHWFETEGCLIRVPHSWSTATRIDMQHLILFYFLIFSYTWLNFSLKDKCNENVTLTLIVPRISRKHWIFQHGSWQAHLRPTSAEATFCGKSRQFSHSPNFSFQHCQVSHKSVPIAQMWISKCWSAEFQLIFTFPGFQVTPVQPVWSLVSSQILPWLLFFSPTGSHTITRSLWDRPWLGRVCESPATKSVWRGGIFAKPGGGWCLLGRPRPTVKLPPVVE